MVVPFIQALEGCWSPVLDGVGAQGSSVRVNGLMGHPTRWSKPEHLGVASGKKEGLILSVLSGA